MSEYIRPVRIPFDIRSIANWKSSDMGHGSGARRRLDVLDHDAGTDLGLPAVLVRDGRGDLDVTLAAVEGGNETGILLHDVPAAQLARARHLRVVCLEVLGEQEEAAGPCGLRQR